MTQEPMMKDSGERRQFETGAVRDRGDFKPRPDLISPHANTREGAWLARGAEKYEVDNWTLGMPIRECFASLCRHAEAYKLGLRDEDHMAAIRTNAGFILHYEEEIKAGRLDPKIDDMPRYEDRAQPWPQQVESPFGGPNVHLIQKTQALLDALPEGNLEMIRGVEADAACDRNAPTLTQQVAFENCVFTEIGKPFTVYLCGPITGVPVDQLWRDAATAYLWQHGNIRTLDPMRGKDTRKIGNLGMDYEGQPATTEMASRDQMDMEQANMIFAHFPYAPPRQSIGSLMEMGGAAIGMGKPIVLCTEVPEFNEHLFTRKFCILEPNFQAALNRIVQLAGHEKAIRKAGL